MKDFNNGPSKDNKIQDGVCPKCYGDGKYYDPEDHVIDECYMCNGTGKRIILYIIRGLPGSGKSTLAQKMLGEGKIDVYYESDMFFLDEKGEYHLDKEKWPEAHEWCEESVRNAIDEGKSVAVSNTFTRRFLILPYLCIARARDVKYEIIECKNSYGSIHNVPESEMTKMRAGWEELDGFFYCEEDHF
jgi:hypothetical protein